MKGERPVAAKQAKVDGVEVARRPEASAPSASANGQAGETALAFEEAMERLEAIVTRLERGELGLEESLTLYEEGVGLARRAQSELERVEGKITALLADGRVQELTDVEGSRSREGSL